MIKIINNNIFISKLSIIITIIFVILQTIPISSTSCSLKNNKNLNVEYKALNPSESYDLLIITPKKFERRLKPLLNHKEKVGVPTNIVTLNRIYKDNSCPGRDKPEKIKYFIKKSVEDWGIKYVLLVGNFRHLPVRYVYNADLWPAHPEPYFISELYYADIYDNESNFSSWDIDNDGIFGEWNGNLSEDYGLDLYPDVFVGRLACRNRFEVSVMVKKIISYESKTYGKDWFNHVVVVGGDTHPALSGYEGEENTKIVLEYMQGFENTTLWTSDGSLSGSKDVVKAINSGCGFIYFDGHSNTRVFCTHPSNDTKMISGLSTLSMIFLINRNMLPICVIAGCNTLQFDVNLLNLIKNLKESWMYCTWVPECWGWKLTRKIFGGSIATIGNTGVRITKEDKKSGEGASGYLSSQFFYEYNINKTNTLGEVWGKAISNYLDKFPIKWDTPMAGDSAYDAKTVQQWVLLGDPSLKIGGYNNT